MINWVILLKFSHVIVFSLFRFFRMINSSKIDQWRNNLILCFNVKFSRLNVHSIRLFHQKRKFEEIYRCAFCLPNILWKIILVSYCFFFVFFLCALRNYLGLYNYTESYVSTVISTILAGHYMTQAFLVLLCVR